MAKLEYDSEGKNCITLYLPNIITDYIRTKSSNRSMWVREAGEEFLTFLKENILGKLNSNLDGRRVITISKPYESELKEIFGLVNHYSLFFSRSEFYRTSAFFRIIKEAFLTDIETKEKYDKLESENPNTVRVPVDKDKDGNHTFRVYKILKKLDF